MKVQSTIKIITLLLIWFVCSIANAKDYVVEMIFFTNAGNESTGSTHISTEPVLPDFSGSLALDEEATSFGFFPANETELTLAGAANALRKSGRHKVLKHIGWQQPGLAKEEAIPIRIHAGNNFKDEFKERQFAQSTFSDQASVAKHPVNELDGTIKVVLGRYLHVYTDLAYRKPYRINASASENALGRERVLADFSVKSHRKMRSKTLHYIDHPHLGILVEIRPVENES